MSVSAEEEIVVVEQGDAYYASISGSIVGGHGNTNTINIHNHELGLDFDKFAQRVAIDAIHNSAKISALIPISSPGVRKEILDNVSLWAASPTYEKPVTWVYGPPKSGKSVLMKTIADMLYDQGRILASFFFMRNQEDHNNPQWIISTIAYQVALAIPEMREAIVKAFEDNPLIFSQSLRVQAQALVIAPIRKIHDKLGVEFPTEPRLIVVDALDECGNTNAQIEVLNVLRYLIEHLPIPVAAIVSSRPQDHLDREFNAGSLSKVSVQINLEDFTDDEIHIKRYLVEALGVIGKATSTPFRTLAPPGMSLTKWPKSGDIDRVVSAASGNFIYVLMVERFVKVQKYPGTYLDFITQPQMTDLLTDSKKSVKALASLATSGFQGLARVAESKSAFNLFDIKWAGIGDEETVRHMLKVLRAKSLLDSYQNWQRGAGQAYNVTQSVQVAANNVLTSMQKSHLPSPSVNSSGRSPDVLSLATSFAKSFRG